MNIKPCVLKACSISLACLCLNCCYLIKQGAGLLKYNARAEDIAEVLAEKATASDVKEFLSLVNEVRRYAVDSVGLSNDKNFTRYVEIDKGYLLDVVCASKDDSFEQYMWWFPFFGSFPYKGFYEKKDAEHEAARLRRKSYDVYVRKADAFSTLGFFDDPVYSFMEDYSAFAIASLIIHEQTHATIFLKDQVQFNEEFATFVGREGALWFIRDKYGEDSEVYRDALLRITDYDAFLTFLRQIYEELDSLYKSGATKEEKLKTKQDIFAKYKTKFVEEYDERFRTQRYRGFKDTEINNAYLASYMTYTQDLSLLYELYERNGRDLRRTVARLKEVKDVKVEPKEYIRKNLLM